MNEKPFDVTLTLNDDDYAVLTIALTNYADDFEFRALDADSHPARDLRESVDRARRIVDDIE